MSIKAYDTAPWNDDFNTSSLEDKNYLRILFKPGFSVQVRELNQMQSMLQSQIDKFGRSVYKEGPILEGATTFDDNIGYVDVNVLATNDALNASINLIKGNTIKLDGTGSEGLSAEIYDYRLLSADVGGLYQWRFYVRYNSAGAAVATPTNIPTFTAAQSIDIVNAIQVDAQVIVGNGAPLGTVVNVGYAARVTTDIGVFFGRGSFIYNSEVKSLYIDKPAKETQVTGKAVFRLDEAVKNFTEDVALLDNAEVSPNYKAPGADRYAITLTPLFLTDQSDLTAIASNSTVLASTTSGNASINYLDLLSVDTSKFVAPARVGYSQLDNKLAVRTSEESGNYTVNPFKVSVREHLNDAAGNNGRYLSSELSALLPQLTNAESEAKYITTVEPSVAYIQGYRAPLTEALELPVDKARTILEEPEVVYGSANIGNYIEGSNIVHAPDFNAPDKLYTFNGTGSVSCRIRAIEKVGLVYRVYIYDLSGDIPRDALTLSGDKVTGGSGFVFTLSDADTSAPTPIYDSANNKNLITLPYNTVQSIEKGGSTPNFNSEVVVRGIQTVVVADGSSLSLTVSSLTPHSAGRFFNDSPNAYIVINQSNGAIVTVTDVTLGGTNNNAVTLAVSSSATCTVIAPVKLKLGSGGLTAKTKTVTTATAEVVATAAVASNAIIDLDNRDIIEIDSVTDTAGAAIDASDYELDNGQRDGLYKVGKIKYIGSGVDGLKVTYKYFAHGAGDFFDVSSYITINYKDIPKYKGTYLSDVLDFRPNDNETSAITLDPNSPTKTTLNYYLSRLDKLVVNTLGDYSMLKGIPANQPDIPAVPSNAMALQDILVPAYTRDVRDIQLRPIDNRRFTMQDIGRLERRVKNLEYYTSLSLLEREANGKQILDADGERFKNGILVDSFQTQGIADVLDSKLNIAFNKQKGFIRPRNTLLNKRLRFNGYDGADNALTRTDGGGTLLTLPYTSTELINQPSASIDISVNPFDLASWNGIVELSPASDEWVEVLRAPDVVYNIEGSNDAATAEAARLNEEVMTTSDEVYLTHSQGAKIKTVNTVLTKAQKAQLNLTGHRPVMKTVTTYDTIEAREAMVMEAQVVTSLTNIGDKVIDVSFIPFIRSRRVYFKAQMLKPNSRMYAFFDGVDVSEFCTQAPFVKHIDNDIVDTSTYDVADPLGELSITRVELISNAEGDLEGFFIIPNNLTYQFKTGTRKFKLTDSSTDNLANTTTSAAAAYVASGLLQTVEAQILSTQSVQIVATGETILEFRPGIVTKTKTAYYDPLAQSFLIGDVPTGTFATKIDLYFKARSENVPLSMHLVTVENGIPTQKRVPFSTVVKKTNLSNNQDHEVNISDTADAATTFEFESPVYLMPGVEYAIVVMSNSPDYRLWMAEVGGDDVTTGTRISKNTYAGVSFKSQNASTWTPDQNKDFKMVIHRAAFTGLSGYTYRLDPMFATGEGAFSFAKLRLQSQDISFTNTSIDYNLRIESDSDVPITPDDDKYFDTVRSFSSADTDGNINTGEAALNITFKSDNDFLSPVVDLDRLSLLGIRYNMTDAETVQPDQSDPLSDNELLAGHGEKATARYITREVELNNAADQLNILLLANKPSSESDIRVYVRVKSTDERISDIGFTKVEPQSPLLISSGNNFGETEYVFENTQLAEVDPFTSFQVKIVFTSENSALAPRVKDLRVIATI
jgi:hypothetical protein